MDFVFLKEKTKQPQVISAFSPVNFQQPDERFVGKKTGTVCQVTEQCSKAFEEDVEDLKEELNI